MFLQDRFSQSGGTFSSVLGHLVLIATLSATTLPVSSAEIEAQTSRVVTVLNGGGTPGLGSGKLKSTAILPVCDVTEVDDEALRFAVLQGLGPFYLAEDPKSSTRGQAYRSQRFLLKPNLLIRHDIASKQATLSGGKFFSMEMSLEALASPERRKVSLGFTTTLFSGTSNDVRKHKVAGGAYDGRFFHEEFAEKVLLALQGKNCGEK